jgi:hypothetical protein
MGWLFGGGISPLLETQPRHRKRSLETNLNERTLSPVSAGDVPTPESTVLKAIGGRQQRTRDRTMAEAA